jgi:general secretion pathway protein J
LIEIMVAVAILAMVVTMVFGTMQNTFKTKSAIEATSSRYRTVRIALERMAREVSMAYLSQNEDTSQQERRTFFVGKRHTDIDELRFSYYGHQRLYQDANESDTAQVAYTPARDREDPRKTNLVRRETRRLSNLKMEDAPGEADIICDDVIKLRLDYWDARDKQWREEWVTTAADGQPDRLPSRVKITLTVHDERGKEVPFVTETRLAMQEPLNLKPADLTPQGQPVPPANATPPGGAQPGRPQAPATPTSPRLPTTGVRIQ